MRTKSILLGAAVMAAGVASSMAQAPNVYSVNVVGYVNVPLPSGYTLVANPLNLDNTNNINNVIPNPPNGTEYIAWNGSGLAQPITFYSGNGWFDQSLNPATNLLNLGTAFFIYNPGASNTVTFVGNVAQGTNTTVITPGYTFNALVAPISSDLDTNGFPQSINGLQYSTFTNGAYTPPVTYYQGSGWFDGGLNQVFPTPNAAQGFLIYNPSANSANWPQTFTVQ